MSLSTLDLNLLTEIFLYLFPTQLIQMSGVCKNFNKLINSWIFWKKYLQIDSDFSPKKIDLEKFTKRVIMEELSDYLDRLLNKQDFFSFFPSFMLKNDRGLVWELIRRIDREKSSQPQISFLDQVDRYIDRSIYQGNDPTSNMIIENILSIDGLFLRFLSDDQKRNPRWIMIALRQNILTWLHINPIDQSNPCLGKWVIDQLQFLYSEKRNIREEHQKLFDSIRQATNLKYYSIEQLEFIWETPDQSNFCVSEKL